MLLLLFRCFFVVALGVGALVVQSIRCVLSTPPCDAHLFSGIEHGRGLASFTEFFFVVVPPKRQPVSTEPYRQRSTAWIKLIRLKRAPSTHSSNVGFL